VVPLRGKACIHKRRPHIPPRSSRSPLEPRDVTSSRSASSSPPAPTSETTAGRYAHVCGEVRSDTRFNLPSSILPQNRMKHTGMPVGFNVPLAGVGEVSRSGSRQDARPGATQRPQPNQPVIKPCLSSRQPYNLRATFPPTRNPYLAPGCCPPQLQQLKVPGWVLV